MNLKVKKFELNKETISRLTEEEAQGVQGAVVYVSAMTKDADSDCNTRCGRNYCIC